MFSRRQRASDDEDFDDEYEEYKIGLFKHCKEVIIVKNGEFTNDHLEKKYGWFITDHLRKKKMETENYMPVSDESSSDCSLNEAMRDHMGYKLMEAIKIETNDIENKFFLQ